VEGGKMVTISAKVPSETRVSYDDGTRKLTWENNDQLLLAGYDAVGNYKGSSPFTYDGSGDTFSGLTVDGATTYKAYYPAGGISLDENGNVQLTDTFWRQTQIGNNSTAHLGDKLIMSDEDARPYNQPFQLGLRNDIIKFNLSNISSDIGTLNKLIWTVQTTPEGETRSATLNIRDVSTGTTDLTAYLAFDPSVMKIAAGGKVKITLIGDKSYEWSKTVDNNVTYQAGNRYKTNVGDSWSEVVPLIYTIKTSQANTTHKIWQTSTSSTCPANLTIDWGDGHTTPIAQGATLDQAIASHTYANADDYTITICSDQTNSSTIQMPQITFNKNITGEDLLTAVLTPFPNMNAKDFITCFMSCSQLTSIPKDLFRYNTQATNFSACFVSCTSLTSIPEDLFKYNTLATNFSGCFAGRVPLTSIPENLFKHNTQATDFSGCFESCNTITSIPTDLFRYNTEATSFNACFNGCEILSSIPTDLFRYNTKVTDFGWCFQGCEQLTAIPEDLFRYNTLVTDFNRCFSHCHILASIPANLFKYNAQVKNFSGCFTYCRVVTPIPVDLFRYNTQATDFSYCFDTCYEVTSIPTDLFKYNTQATDFAFCFSSTRVSSISEDLFRYNTLATSFNGTFAGCHRLTTLPANLFRYNTEVVNFSSCFSSCSGLTSIPEDLFRYNTKATRFWCCFSLCSQLASIPEDLFKYNTEAYDFYMCFYSYKGADPIPANLFRYNTKAKDFTYCFSGSTQITSIPADLFRYNTLATRFYGCFSRCTELITLPADLFRYNTKATDFEGCFRDCKKLVLREDIFPLPSVSPNFFSGRKMSFRNCFYNVGTQAASPGTAPKLWLFNGGGAGTRWTITNCFTGATQLTNYNDIPSTWGGGGV